MGIIGGSGKLNFSDTKVTSLNLDKKTIKDNFYGIHFGKRYKFTRHFYTRIELEYMKYKYEAKNINLNNSLEFIYGCEYRF